VRARLDVLRNEILKTTLTLVIAPAGYGKTTLLTQWRAGLQAAGTTVAWVSLAEEDNSPHRLLSYMAAALSAECPHLCDGTSEMLSAGPMVPVQAVEAVLLSELQVSERELVLVLDDYHYLGGSGVQLLMGHFLHNLPANVHLVFSSRTEPALNLTRLKVNRQLLRVGVEDIRFDQGDLGLFVRNSLSLEPSSTLLRDLYDVSEGWIAGVQLATLSPRFKSEPQLYLQEFSSKSKDLHAYLAEVVLDLLPGELERVLLRCAILDRFSAELCEVVAGVLDGKALLDKLIKVNPFISALDEQGEWYRFHRLFLEFLRKRLKLTPTEDVMALHRVACDWFAARSLWAEGVQHALACGDNEKAQDFIERCALDMLGRSRTGKLLSWGRRLPEEMLRKKPELRLAIARAQVLMMDLRGAATLLEGMAENQADLDAGAERFAVQQQITRGLIFALDDHFDAALAQALPLVERLQGLNITDREMLLNTLALVYLYQGRFDQIDAMQSWQMPGPGMHFGVPYRLLLEGLGWMWRGRLDKAEYIFKKARQYSEQYAGRRSMVTIASIVCLADLYYERNQLEEAEELLTSVHTVPLDLGISEIIQSGYRTMSRINQINGAKTEAWVLLDEMEAVAFKRRWPRLEANCRAQRIQSEIWSGDLSAARNEFARLSSLSDHEQLDPVVLRLIADETLISRARICCFTGLNAELIENLGRRVADLEVVGVHYLGARMRMLLALLHWLAGEQVAAARALLPALALGKTQGFRRIFIDEVRHLPEALVGICNEVSRVDASFKSYLDSLLAEAGAALLPSAGQDGAAGGGRTSVEGDGGLSDLELLSSSEITEREKEILSQVANGLYNKEIARVLGISEGTVKWHLKNLYSKLSVSSRTQALKKSKLLGLID
jgi:LuxR family maltose regulon positive regulatory protein